MPLPFPAQPPLARLPTAPRQGRTPLPSQPPLSPWAPLQARTCSPHFNTCVASVLHSRARAAPFPSVLRPLPCTPHAHCPPPPSTLQTLDKVVTTGATATYSVTYNFLPLTPTVDDLCADQKDDLCPLAIGLHNSKSNSAWPSGLSGTIVSKIQWKDQDGQEILCMQWTVSGN